MTAVRRPKLSRTMTLDEFDAGYWYATALRRFATQLGIAESSRMRKNELEAAIKSYLTTGRYARLQRPRVSIGVAPDVDRGLRLDLPVRRYTNNVETKRFLETQARALSPAHKQRSGARYRLNRWREQQITSGKTITYRDLVAEYVRLCQPDVPFARVTGDYYVYFLADFLRSEPNATRAAAIRAWHQIKHLRLPNSYQAWKAKTKPD
jgi:hypothetical protein